MPLILLFSSHHAFNPSAVLAISTFKYIKNLTISYFLYFSRLSHNHRHLRPGVPQWLLNWYPCFFSCPLIVHFPHSSQSSSLKISHIMLISYSESSDSLPQNSFPWLTSSSLTSFRTSFPSPSFSLSYTNLCFSKYPTAMANLKTFFIFSYWVFFLQICICYSCVYIINTRNAFEKVYFKI